MERVRVLGVDVDPIAPTELAAMVSGHVRDRSRLRVANHNLHSAYLVRDDDLMGRWHDLADVVFVDGMSLVVASRLTGGDLRREHRATIADWMPLVLDAAARDRRVVFHLGGAPEWVDAGIARWRRDHPGLAVHAYHGFFAPEESAAVVTRINAVSPDLLLVGMGSPVQERWLVEHLDELDVPVVVVVGAFLGYAAGAEPLAPRWLGRAGLEWAYRLAANPRRMARRYLFEPLALGYGLLRDRARLRRGEPGDVSGRGRGPS